jgi:hypothetical protein
MNLPGTDFAPLGKCGASDDLGINFKPHIEERLFNNHREQIASPDQLDSMSQSETQAMCRASDW